MIRIARATVLLAAVLGAGWGFAPPAMGGPPGPDTAAGRGAKGEVTTTYRLRVADPDRVVRVLALIGGRAVADPDLGVVVWRGPAELAPAVTATIRTLDARPASAANVELTFQFLAEAGDAVGREVPGELEGVQRQLRSVFGVARLRLLESAAVRVREGAEARLEGTLPTPFGAARTARYRLAVGRLTVTGEEGSRSVHLDDLRLTVRGYRTGDARSVEDYEARTDLDLTAGQRVVVTRASMNGLRSGLFLVVGAKVLE